MRFFENTLIEIKSCNQPIVLIDIDGVMQNNQHRLHHIVQDVDGKSQYRKNPDWDSFTQAAHLDSEGAFCRVIRKLQRRVLPVYLTARIDSLVDDRRDQLLKRLSEVSDDGLLGNDYPILIMRPVRSPHTEWESASLFKQRITKMLLSEGLDILFAVDDSHENCKMFATLGIPTLRLYNHLTETQWDY